MKKLLFILLFVGIFLISGCNNTVVPSVDEDSVEGFIDCPGSVGEFCIEIYQPVCGDDGDTYSNSCVACQTVGRYREGECE